MNVSFQIARRYLFGKKRANAINVITGISVLGIAIGTAALILILSVFNGFESLSRSYLDKFNPDIKILPMTGKYFSASDSIFTIVDQTEGVDGYAKVIEEVAHFRYKGKQQIGMIKGGDRHYLDVIALDSAIIDGVGVLRDRNNVSYAIAGEKIYNALNISVTNPVEQLRISVPNRRKRGILDKDFRSRAVPISGAYSIKNDKDSRYVIIDYTLATNLLDLKNQVSALEVKLEDPSRSQEFKRAILAKSECEGFQVWDREEQDASILKIMRVEKWTSYVIFSFTLLLIIFNVIGCLWMIVLEKKKDISVLQSFGATKHMVQGIFLREGGMISLLGFGVGFTFAVIFYLLQQSVGIISVPDGFAIANYPMVMEARDVLVIFLTVMTLGIVASIPAALRASRISPYVRME